MTNLIGQSLGRYHILEQLGEGGMAIVYKAYDTRLAPQDPKGLFREKSSILGRVSCKRSTLQAKETFRVSNRALDHVYIESGGGITLVFAIDVDWSDALLYEEKL